MAYPVSEQITALVKQRLAAISTDDGYETTQSGVIRPTRIATHHPKDYQLIVTQLAPQPNRALSYMGNPPVQGYSMTVVIAGELRSSESDTNPIDRLRNTFAADVTKALCDATDWHNWGGLAVDSAIGPATYVTTDEFSGFQMNLLIGFRTEEGDPYVSR